MFGLMNYRFMPFLDSDGGTGGAAGGASDPNPGEPGANGSENGGGTPSLAKFGNVEVDLSTPEGQAAAVKAYENAAKFGQTKSQELAELKKLVPATGKPEVKAEEKPGETKKEFSTSDFVATQVTNQAFDKLITEETARLEAKYGDKFALVKDEFAKTLNDGKANLDLTRKQAVITKGNLESVFKNLYTEAALNAKPAAKVEETIGKKEGQEILPGTPPPGGGIETTPGTGGDPPKADFDFSNTAAKARAARLAETNKGLSQ